MTLATLKFAMPSVDNAGRPYVMLFHQTIDIETGTKRALAIKVVNCKTSYEAAELANCYGPPDTEALPH